MHLKLLCLYVIMVQNICTLNTIFVGNIVRFTCNNCSEAETCCLGTLIQPHIVLTTSFCANFCQVFIRGQIVNTIKIFTYPHSKKYFGLQDTEDYSIALASLEPMFSKRYVALSAVEPITTIGLKIMIPVVNERNIFLQSAVIQRCENAYTQSSALHVCTGKVISDLKSCQKVQGAPLLLSDRLLGMSIVQDCRLMQRVFIAVGPSLFWIHSMIEHIQRDHQKHLVLRHAVPTRPVLTSTEITTRWKVSKSSSTNLTTLTTNVIQVEQSNKRFANINKTKTTKEDVRVIDITKNETRLLNSVPARSQDVRDPVTTSNGSGIRHQTSTSSFASETISTNLAMPLSNRSYFTKVMDWFKKEKSRLNEKPQAYLVLTRPPVRQETAEFIDLT